jgi:hypothetical protein
VFRAADLHDQAWEYMTGSREPKQLRQGKRFHKKVQREWLQTAKNGKPIPERSIKKLNGRNGRVDILVEDFGDFISIVEIKATDWDQMTEKNIIRNVRRQILQIWSYIDSALELEGQQVCPGVIFPKLPRDPERLHRIESLFNDEGIQVVWHDETLQHLRKRMGYAVTS